MIFSHYIYPLVATIIIEFIVLRLLKENDKKVLLSSVIINTLTNLPLNLFVPNDMVSIAIAEVVIVMIEAIWYYLFVKDIKKAIAEKIDEVKAYVIKDDVKEITLRLGALTDHEREIILKGCLINFNKKS